MDRRRLSERLKQPSDDRTFLVSEQNFITHARACLDFREYEVVPNPPDLRRIFPGLDGLGGYGVLPEAAIVSKKTGRRFFVEVKKQGPTGNAEERAFKHHTVQFYKTLQAAYNYTYHPYVTILCESLASLPKYTTKFYYLIEPDHYLLWTDYDHAILCDYLTGRCRAWLDD